MSAYAIPWESAAEARERLILEHLPQVRLIARRMLERLPGSVSLDDLVSAGTLGLIAAVDNFDSTRDIKLKTYAEHKIRGAIYDSLRSLDWAPRQQRKRARQIESAILAAERRLGRAPAEDEIAAELNVSLDEYHSWLVGIQALTLGTFEQTRDDAPDLLQYVPDSGEQLPSAVLERSELQRVLADAIERMPRVERSVLGLYYREEMTLKEIAVIMKLHESRISQIKTQAVARLRVEMQKRWPGRRTE